MSQKRSGDVQPNVELACKMTSNAPLTDASQFQDGDNSLEPGEVVTPPHQLRKSSASPATLRDADAKLKKILAKDVMTKTLRKLSRIDTDTCEEKVRAILELEVIKRKEAKLFKKQAMPVQPIENGIDAEKKVISTAAEALATPDLASTAPPTLENNDDSEGLYSDTDSSTEDYKNLEDVQKARKEKQAEAEAARTPAQLPGPHQFYPISPLRFHMRPPCYDFRPMGFMPRMSPRGGMRGMRPCYFNKRPPAPISPMQMMRPANLVPASSIPLQSNASLTSPAAYGPALPPTASRPDSPSKNNREPVTVRSKTQQSDVVWTKAQPSLPYIYNLVMECSNEHHKSCKRRSKLIEGSSSSTKKHTKSKDNSTEPHRERSKERHKSSHASEAKHVKKLNRSKSKSKSHKEERKSKDDGKSKTPPVTSVNNAVEELRLTPPPIESVKDSRKAFDIFADSPPRLAQPESVLSTTPKKPPSMINLAAREPKVLPADQKVEKCIVERSTTPPLTGLCNKSSNTPTTMPAESKTTPLHKASEIHSRIDALLQDNDLHLEALLATKEQLLRKTNEHRSKISNSRETSKPAIVTAKETSQKKLHEESGRAQEGTVLGVRIKQEPIESQSSSSSRHSNEHKVEKERNELNAVEQPRTPSPRQESLRLDNPFKRGEAVLNEHSTRYSPNRRTDKHHRSSHEQRNEDCSADRQRKDNNLSRNSDRSDSREAHTERSSSSLRHDSNGRDERCSNERHTRSDSRGRAHNNYRNSSHANRSFENQAEPPNEQFVERTIKIERNRSKTPERRPVTPLQHKPLILHHIKVERDATPPLVDITHHLRSPPTKVLNNFRKAADPPVHNGNIANVHQSPDTDDYIDNWENDDSTAGDSSTPKMPVPTSRQANQVNGFVYEDDDEEASNNSNRLWNAKCTPPPKARYKPAEMLPLETAPPAKALINIHELYEKFMKSIKMNNTEAEASDTVADTTATATVNSDPSIVKCEEPLSNGILASSSEASKNSSLSNSTAEESSSTESTSSSSSSDDDDDDDDDEEDDNEDEEDEVSSSDEQASTEESIDKTSSLPTVSAKDAAAFKQAVAKPESHKRNNVSKDLRKLKSLEDNLARIQMMRENYDSGDDICEELLKMESLFIMQRNAIMDKYRKNDLKLSEQKKVEPEQQSEAQPEQLQSPINNIFDTNREAIKLTISPLKLTRKSAILDKDDGESNQQPKVSNKIEEKDFTEKLAKPIKEIAIVKPTIMDTKLKRSSTPTRRRTRERSTSRNQSRRPSLNRMRPNRHRGDSRSLSPRRWPRSRIRFGKYMTRSRSRSFSRSRSRSRSPNRRWRLKFGRRRNSLSPPPLKLGGPRSPPPPMRRRSYSRERCSRSPLPFKPPSPPMRRSWSSSQSRSPEQRRTRSPHRRSPFDEYFEENHSLEAAASAAAYYYNMSLLHGGEVDPNSEHYESYAAYAAYMDTAYNMSLSSEDAYAQYMEYSNMMPGTEEQMLAALPPELSSTFYNQYSEALAAEAEFSSSVPAIYDVPKAPVAVQKGNVLEIVPSNEPTVDITKSLPPKEEPVEDIVQAEDTSKPKRKRVNFVDKVFPNNDSDDEDRKVVQQAVERAIKKIEERRDLPAKLQRVRRELLALPPPPPPAAAKPPHLEKATFVGKKSKFHFYNFDPFRATIVRAPTRLLRPPRFDPKYMAMLMKTGRLPLPRFPFHTLRHRPPLPPHALAKATADVRAVMLKDNLIRIPSHPPPPLGHIMHGAMRPPFFDNFLRLRAPVAGVPAPVCHPIPVVGQDYSFPPTSTPVNSDPRTSPHNGDQAMTDAASAEMPRNMYGVVVPPLHLTPPPLPDLPSLQPMFSVKVIPAITEIMPVDILEQLGPLPKTLDLDVAPVSDEANTDLRQVEADALLTESPVTSSPSHEDALCTGDNADSLQQSQQLVESQ